MFYLKTQLIKPGNGQCLRPLSNTNIYKADTKQQTKYKQTTNANKQTNKHWCIFIMFISHTPQQHYGIEIEIAIPAICGANQNLHFLKLINCSAHFWYHGNNTSCTA